MSWLLLRGACRDCGERISVRYPLVELGTAVMFAVVTWWNGLNAYLPAFLVLATAGIALALTDAYHMRLPNKIVLPSFLVGLALLCVGMAVHADWDRLPPSIGGAVGLMVFYTLVRIVPNIFKKNYNGMGIGDIKLASILGLYLGFAGWYMVVVGTFFSFLVGAIVGIGLIVGTGTTGKAKVPMGVFMIVGTWLALWFGQPFWDWYMDRSGL